GLDAEPGESGRLLLLYCHSRAPLRQTYTYAISRIRRKKANSAKPNHASWCRTTPSGYRKTISMSKTMKSIAVRYKLIVKRCRRSGPVETPDSNGIPRARVRRFGWVAKTNDITIIEVGIAAANSP